MRSRCDRMGVAGVALTVLLLAQVGVVAQSGTWTNTQSGAWSDNGNWLNGIVADGTNSIADLNTVDLTSAVTNHLDSPRTIGRVVFGDADTHSPAAWTLDDNGDPANILTFEGPAMQPGITVSNRATVDAPIRLLGTTSDIDVSDACVLTLSGSVDTTGNTVQKSGGGVLNMAARYGATGTRPVSHFHAGTVSFVSNSVYSRGIYTRHGGPNVNIVVDNAIINVSGSILMRTVYATGVLDMRGGSLTADQIRMAASDNYGANQSLFTVSDGAVVKAASGLLTGDKADTGGATSFVLKDGSVDTSIGGMTIGIRAGENFFTQLGGTVAGESLTLQWRMNVDWSISSLYNLNGGSLTVGEVLTGDGTANFDLNNAYFNFHGGSLKAARDQVDFFRTTITGDEAVLARPRVVVWSEGAVIDTGGHTIASLVPFVAPSGSGLYADTNRALTVSVVGSDGGWGYKATPLVRLGILSRGNTTKSAATAIANMTDDGTGNGTFRIESFTITNPGMNYTTTPTLTIHGGDPVMPAVVPALTLDTNLSGSLTKLGLGTLTLSATNTYTGDTIVKGGRLVLEHACLADDADLHIAGNATFAIEFDGEDVIHGLYVNGEAMPKGKYYSGDLGSAILGSGVGCLKVTSGAAAGVQLLVR